MCLAFWFALLCPLPAQTAPGIETPAILVTNNGTIASNIDIVSLLLEITWLRHDPAQGTTTLVMPVMVNGGASLLPGPVDSNGQPLMGSVNSPMATLLPLSPAGSVPLFANGEPLFFSAQYPSLANDPFVIDTASVRVRIYSSSNALLDEEDLLVTETGLATGIFTGYLQNDAAAGGPGDGRLAIPPDARVEIVDIDDIPDGVFHSLVSAGIGPVTAGSATLFVSKRAARELVAAGDYLAYDVTVDASAATAGGVTVTDTLPPGFRYTGGSFTLDGAPQPDPTVAADGRTLNFAIGNVTAGQRVALRYVVQVTAGARPGRAVNSARATSAAGVGSNLAQYTVKVQEDLFRTHGFVVGRVLFDSCGATEDASSSGIANVRIYLEDGSTVVTDKFGRYHVAGIKPGTHVVQVDKASLPEDLELVPCVDNTRYAGNGYSQFLEVRHGGLFRIDFHARRKLRGPYEYREIGAAPGLVARETAPQARQGLSLRLSSSSDYGFIRYRAEIGGENVEYKDLALVVQLAEGLQVVRNSTKRDGNEAALVRNNGIRTIPLGNVSGNFSTVVEFDAMSIGDGHGDSATYAEALTRAWLGAEGLDKGRSPHAENSVRLGNGTGGDEVNITVSTNFPPMSATLSGLDKLKLDDVVMKLRELEEAHVRVTGHTDSVPIPKPRKGQKKPAFPDNNALSEARARAVADYLREQLALPEEVVTIVGAGAAEPLHDNRTAEGRAQNRRVEVSASSRTSREAGEVAVVRGDSGLQAVDLTPAAGESMLLAATPEPVIEPVVEPVVEPAPTPAPAADNESPMEDIKPGFLDLADGAHLAQRIQQVRLAMDSRLTPKLTVDGVEVPAARIGFRGTDHKTRMTLYSYIGVDFGERGEHEIRITGTDTFGNARLDQAIRIQRTGDIADVEFVGNGENLADGLTPVTLRVRLLDEQRREIPAHATLQLLESDLVPDGAEQAINPLAGTRSAVKVSADGSIRFKPVSQSGRYHIRLAWAEGRARDFTVFVKPHFRDWIVVGVAEGSAAFHELSGNLAALPPDARDEGFSVDGRTALYARGRVRGDWLLTMAWDSDKSRTDGLTDRINPAAWYTVYGDTSSQTLDAASQRKLYLKIERENFYALFGDFQTGMENTELSRYQRRLNGAKAEFWGARIDVLGFVSETPQAYVREEIRGDGTAGLYNLSRPDIIPGSEKIRIEVRDRFHQDVVVETRGLTPYVDYQFDADSGNVWFKEPVRASDDSFNPVFIVVEYEVDNGIDGVTGGVRVVTRPLSGLTVGITGVHEGVGNGNASLAGIDADYTLDERNKFHAELANTASNMTTGTATPAGATGDGAARLLRHEYRDAKLSVDTEFRENDEGFGLGQQSGSEDARRKLASQARYNLSDALSVSGELSRDEQTDLDRTRDIAEARMNLTRDERDVFGGVRLVRDDASGVVGTRESQQLIGGIRQRLFDKRLQLKLEGETNIAEDDPDSVDYPHRLRAGSDYRLNNRTMLFAEQEWAWGDGQDSEHSRAGVRYVPWQGAQANTSIGRDLTENGPRVYANAGLVQNWQITPNWTADAGIDRVQTLEEPGTAAFNPDLVPANGAGAEDFTALFLGAGYQDLVWQWRGRVETRDGASEDKLNLFSGLFRKFDDATTLGNSLRYLRSARINGDRSTTASVQFDYAWRPLAGRWVILDQLRYVNDRRESGGQSIDGQRLVNNLNTHWRYDARNEVSLQYGAKYVFDTVDARRYTGYTDLVGTEYRRDLDARWHVGARTSLLHSWNAGALDESFGVFVGYSPEKNIQVAVGYNFRGFRDDDFSGANYHDQGFNLALRIKFDQDSLGDLARGHNRLSGPRRDPADMAPGPEPVPRMLATPDDAAPPAPARPAITNNPE